MQIIADENIPYVREAFGTLGRVSVMPGRRINAKKVRDADILLVRSVTKVDEALLAGSRVRFVGTATIGTDHIDEAYLDSEKIGFAAAPGSNATSVAEYVTAALLVLARECNRPLKGTSIGIVGVGNVGSRVEKRCRALGMKVLLNDPPLKRETGAKKFVPIERIFTADIVTIHTPLTYEGPDATYQMVNEDFVAQLKAGSILINTARGQIAETRALKRALDGDQLREVVIDVWENEPNPDDGLVERAAIATAHIAGYALDGKVRGTEMIYRAACKFLGKRAVWKKEAVLAEPPVPVFEANATDRSDEDVIREAVLTVCDIEGDDQRMRRTLRQPAEKRGAFFDRLRKNYPVRREFHNTTIVLKRSRPALRNTLKRLEFEVK